MKHFDFIIVGAGMAGASVAYELAEYGTVCVLEKEAQPGFHATGRSAAFYDPSYGSEPVRKMTLASRGFLEHPPEGFCEHPLLSRRGILVIAKEDQMDSLNDYNAKNAALLGELERLDAGQLREMVPVLREQAIAGILSANCDDLDVGAQHHGYLALLKKRGVVLLNGHALEDLRRADGGWILNAGAQRFFTPWVVNAAGAWADPVAKMASLKGLGLTPFRRNVFTFQPSSELDFDLWPLVMDVDESFYFKPDAGAVLATPADEEPCAAGDAQVDDYQIALGVDRVEQATTFQIDRLKSQWAGYRTFAPDRNLVIGNDPRTEGFFWVAGQGGYGIMSAPGYSRLACSMITGSTLHADLESQAIDSRQYQVERLLQETSV